MINCGYPRRVFVFKLTFARIASFRTLSKTGVEMTKKCLFIYLPTLPKCLCLVFSNLCNILMLIAAQALRLSRVRGGGPSYLMHGLCATNDTCRHKNGNTSGGERKVCTLNAKGTAGRRRPKRSRQKLSSNYFAH